MTSPITPDAGVEPGTPLPWRDGEDGTICGPHNGYGMPVVADILSDDWVDDARYIAAACNAYPDLLAALEEARLQLEYMDERSPSGTTPAVLAKVRAAIAKAGGQAS